MLESPSRSRRQFLQGIVLAAGALALPGCGDGESAPVGTPGAAPVDNDEAARQKAMEDFMKTQGSSKKK